MATTTIEKFLKDFHAQRKCATPIIAVTTADQFATLDLLTLAILNCETAKDKAYAVLQHDVLHGLVPVRDHDLSKDVFAQLGMDPKATTNPVEVLKVAETKLPKRSVILLLNAQRHFVETPTRMIQALANVRDAFKRDRRMVVLLTPEFTAPKELEHDIVTLDVPLPTGDELRTIVIRQHENTRIEALKNPKKEIVDAAIAGCAGLPQFAAEQVIASSLTAKGLDIEAVWDRKRRMIRNTPGLSVWAGHERFESIGGLANIKRFLTRLGSGPNRPSGIVFIDEIEKDTAGMKGDNTGIAQKQHKALLTFMQDKEARGILLDGQPGAGKTTIAKAFGNEIGIPTIALNLGDVQGSLVGQSEEMMRNALKTIDAVCQGRALFIATCNDVKALSPELRGRFKNGHFFFDLPTEEERETIWSLYLAKYGFKANEKRPYDHGWVGREIEACCDQAYSLGCSLVDAARYIVSQGVAMREMVDARRDAAHERIISASYDGLYDKNKMAQLQHATGDRDIEVM